MVAVQEDQRTPGDAREDAMERITIHPVISVDTIPCEPDVNLIKVTAIFDISTSQTAAIPSTPMLII